ncbi:MAG: glycosyltransferase family 4 protein [bacterium]|nr:glycosyltransferase family 4 protein [bacterium]
MKVLILTTLFPNQVESIKGIFIKEQLRWLKEYCEIKYIVSPSVWFPPIPYFKKWYMYSRVPKVEKWEDITIFHPKFLALPRIRWFDGFFYLFSVFWLIKRIKKDYDFDLLHVHFAYPDGFVGVLLGKIFKKPVVLSVRGGDINISFNKFLLRKMIMFTLKNANQIHTVSDDLRDKLCQLKMDQGKIKLIPNGVDATRFKLMDTEEVRNRLGLPKDRPILLFVGRLIAGKALPHLLLAVKDLMSMRKDVLLVIVGDGPEKGKLTKMVNRNHLEKNIKFVGQKGHEEIPLWLNACDLFCLFSLSEGRPNVIIEALACGKPVVATKVGGVQEIVKNEDYGLLVTPGDIKEMSAALNKGLSKDWNRLRLVEYTEQFSWSSAAKQIFDIYKRAVNCGDGERID